MLGNNFEKHVNCYRSMPCSNCGTYDEVKDYFIKKDGHECPGPTEVYIYKYITDNCHYADGVTYIYLCDSCKRHFDEAAISPEISEGDGGTYKDIVDNTPVEIHSTCQRCRTNNPKSMILCRDLDVDFFGINHVDLCDKCFKEIKKDIKESKEVLFFRRLSNCKTSQLAAALNKASYINHSFNSGYDPELFILDENGELPSNCQYNPMNIKVIMKARHGDPNKHAVYLIPYKEEDSK